MREHEGRQRVESGSLSDSDLPFLGRDPTAKLNLKLSLPQRVLSLMLRNRNKTFFNPSEVPDIALDDAPFEKTVASTVDLEETRVFSFGALYDLTATFHFTLRLQTYRSHGGPQGSL